MSKFTVLLSTGAQSNGAVDISQNTKLDISRNSFITLSGPFKTSLPGGV